MNNINQKRNFFLRHGISITLAFLIIIVIVISNIISINQHVNINTVKIGTTSYLGITKFPVKQININQKDSNILLNINNKSITFKVDSINEYFNMLYLFMSSGEELPDVFSAKLKESDKTLWDIIFLY